MFPSCHERGTRPCNRSQRALNRISGSGPNPGQVSKASVGNETGCCLKVWAPGPNATLFGASRNRDQCAVFGQALNTGKSLFPFPGIG
jgi:hypothetical protein